MDLLQAIALGVLQGITEWLPISSRTQVMVVALNFFGMGAESAARSAIFLHIGTVIAAAAYFRKELVKLAKLRDRPLLWFIFTALAGTAVTAAPIYLMVRKAYSDPFLVMLLLGAGLVATGLLQLEKKTGKFREKVGNGFLTGLAQGFSAIPGISRSGVTTAAMLFQNFEPEEAFRISFILSVPSVLLAEIAFAAIEEPVFEPNLLAAVAAAAVVGFVSVGALLRLARRINFAWFCIGFGALYLALAFV